MVSQETLLWGLGKPFSQLCAVFFCLFVPVTWKTYSLSILSSSCLPVYLRCIQMPQQFAYPSASLPALITNHYHCFRSTQDVIVIVVFIFITTAKTTTVMVVTVTWTIESLTAIFFFTIILLLVSWRYCTWWLDLSNIIYYIYVNIQTSSDHFLVTMQELALKIETVCIVTISNEASPTCLRQAWEFDHATSFMLQSQATLWSILGFRFWLEWTIVCLGFLLSFLGV